MITQTVDEAYMVRSMSINNLADATRQLADQIRASNRLSEPKVITVEKPVYIAKCNCWWCRLRGK